MYPIAILVTLVLTLSLSASLPTGPPVTPPQGSHRLNFGPEVRHRSYKPLHDNVNNLLWSPSSATSDPVEVAKAFAQAQVNSDFTIKSFYTSDLNGVTHVYLRQKIHGLEVVNGDININIDRHGRVMSYGDSFNRGKRSPWYLQRLRQGARVIMSAFGQVTVGGSDGSSQYSFIQSKQPVITPSEAIMALFAHVRHVLPDPRAVDDLDADSFIPVAVLQSDDRTATFADVPFALSPVTVRQAYIQTTDNDLLLVWDIDIEMDEHWFNAHINAHDGAVVGLVDWVADAAYYNVIPFGNNDPRDTTQTLVRNPHDLFASPEGWHAQGVLGGHIQLFNVTVGNNVYAHTNPDGGYNWEDNYRPAGKIAETGDIVFDYQANFEKQEPVDYEDAAVTNLFYWCNIAHDLYYRYGFDEKAGNFQQDNLGRGRQQDNGAGDAVVANAQDGSGRNNANFATPPDGRHGKMRMYVWDVTKPMRDGDFESGIIIHEYTHGVSNRLTGGPHNSNCLGWGEAGGMGEGWGDFVATIIRMNASHTREAEFGMGDWANGGEGIRKYKYSTSNITNPSTYRIMDGFDYWGVHAKGEVWAEMLYEVYWNLVDRHGFTPEWFPPLPGEDGDLSSVKQHIVSFGNTLALQLVLDGMKLQPCSPSFLDARDAILDADIALTGGENYCLIYQAFAKRGMGYGAKLVKDGWMEKRLESYNLPLRCQ